MKFWDCMLIYIKDILTLMGVGESFHIGIRVFDDVEKIIFDTEDTLSLEEPTIKPLKACLKDDGNFLVIKYKEFQFH